MARESELVIPGAEPFRLRAAKDCALGRCVVLIHGFGDAPQTIRALAEDLCEHGYDVVAPLLPGHGRTIAAFDASSHEDWIAATRAALIRARIEYSWVALAGLSMGGALASIIASEVDDLPALVLLAPYLKMPRYVSIAAAAYQVWSWAFPTIERDSPESVHDPVERERTLGYRGVTGHSLHELRAVVKRARQCLPSITAPCLIILSQHDNRVPVDVATWAKRRLGSPCRMVVTEVGGHILTVDYGRERVFEEVRQWLDGAGRETGSSTSAISTVSV